MALGRIQSTFMQHTKLIEQFVREGRGGRGTLVKADNDLLCTKIPQVYRPYGNYGWRDVSGRLTPLAVRLEDGSLLANGARMRSPMEYHQAELLHTLDGSKVRFGVVPFHSIVAAMTRGKVRDWDQAPVPIGDLRREVAIVVPSSGEH